MDTPPLYDLFAVVNHRGDMGGGHYTSFVCKAGEWFQCDDDIISRVLPSEVLCSQGYLLFYIQRTIDCNPAIPEVPSSS